VDHLGAEPHDQNHWFCGGIAEDFVTKVDAICVGNLRRLMGGQVHLGVPSWMVWRLSYDTVLSVAEGVAIKSISLEVFLGKVFLGLTGPAVWYHD
jgi:hypothetical protein